MKTLICSKIAHGLVVKAIFVTTNHCDGRSYLQEKSKISTTKTYYFPKLNQLTSASNLLVIESNTIIQK